MFTVEIIYALIQEQKIFTVNVEEERSIEQVICQSGILKEYPEIDLSKNKVGIYNQIKKLDEIVNQGDRVEIYRNLIANPKEKRLQRAKQQREEGVIK